MLKMKPMKGKVTREGVKTKFVHSSPFVVTGKLWPVLF
jgi:hypothetical protein